MFCLAEEQILEFVWGAEIGSQVIEFHKKKLLLKIK